MTTTSSMIVKLCILLCCFQFVGSEIRPFHLLLEPSSDYIHYVEGFLLAPGSIDLSHLEFVGVSQQQADEYNAAGDSDAYYGEGKDGNGDRGRRVLLAAGAGAGRRKLKTRTMTDSINSSSSESSAIFADDDDKMKYAMEGSTIDIAAFHLPNDCASTRSGCDWIDLGIGARSDDGEEVRWCCSPDAVQLGLCRGTQMGRLILQDNFDGKHRSINVPETGEYSDHLTSGPFKTKDQSGKFVVVFANCNDNGRPIMIQGKTVWKSNHGYLPGDLFGLMYFYALLFLVYLAVLIWYGIAMKMHEEQSIQLQNWIWGTISIGTLELFFRAGDLFVWNEDGSRFWIAFYLGVILGVLKRGISGCLVLMVSLGWGVVRDDLGPAMKKIYVLGALYVSVALVEDIMTVVAYTEIQRLSQHEEDELFDIVSILNLVVTLIDAIFFFWIIDSLNATMEYLEAMKQTSKLLRFLRLRSIIMFAILFFVMYTVFGIVNNYDQGIVGEESEWVLDASSELIYLFVLIGIAILWRPQENSREYAFVMELPSLGATTGNDDEGDDAGVVELGVVPSAMDSYDDDDEVVIEFAGGKSEGGFQDEPDKR